MSLEPSNTTFHASAHYGHAAVTALVAANRDWRLEYQHSAEPCLLLKRSNGKRLRAWTRRQAVAILSHPRVCSLLCLPSLCHSHCISLDKTQAQTLLMIAACCSLADSDDNRSESAGACC